MRTLLRLEDALDDNPQMRSLLKLFEEDANNLKQYVGSLCTAVKRVTMAQNELANAMQHLSTVLSTYKQQTLPLDQTEYDMPVVMSRMDRTFAEVSSWLDVVGQQLLTCVLVPIDKLRNELESVCGVKQITFHSIQHDLFDMDNRFAKLGRKESAKKTEEANNDVFFAKRKFHEVALQYYSRLNGLQFMRYTHVVEPMLAFLYALRSFFHTGNEGLGQAGMTDFLTRTQEQMQSIHSESKEEQAVSSDLMETVSQIQQMDRNLYYAEPVEMTNIVKNPNMSQKQGYLYLKSRSGLFSHWEQYYLFTQGSHLMCQKPTELAGQVLLDLATPATSASITENEDRRFTFHITTLSGAASLGSPKSAKTQQLIFQARNGQDLWEWVTVVNNLTGNESSQPQTEDKGPTSNALQIPGAEGSPLTGTTPSNTPCMSETDSGVGVQGDDRPIQFDILGAPAGDLGKSDESEVEAEFEVRFLGSMDVMTDRGDRMVHETIRHIMAARALHSIFAMSENKMLICGKSLRLIDPHNQVMRAAFGLADLAYWTTHPENERLFAFIARTAKHDNEAPNLHSKFTCYVFEAHGSGSGADVCRALREGTRRAFQDLLARKTSAQKEEKEAEAVREQLEETGVEDKAESSA